MVSKIFVHQCCYKLIIIIISLFLCFSKSKMIVTQWGLIFNLTNIKDLLHICKQNRSATLQENKISGSCAVWGSIIPTVTSSCRMLVSLSLINSKSSSVMGSSSTWLWNDPESSFLQDQSTDIQILLLLSRYWPSIL